MANLYQQTCSQFPMAQQETLHLTSYSVSGIWHSRPTPYSIGRPQKYITCANLSVRVKKMQYRSTLVNLPHSLIHQKYRERIQSNCKTNH